MIRLKFASVDELRRQIELDLVAANEFFRRRDASPATP
jgi:FAD synthase